MGSDRPHVSRSFVRRYFNPRSPCGERLKPMIKIANKKLFQSTLPVWGATSVNLSKTIMVSRFQSTLPVWGATANPSTRTVPVVISIHAPRVGSDRILPALQFLRYNFNPRSPCGERRVLVNAQCQCVQFQSTLPVWGATPGLLPRVAVFRFQSTLPVWGATCSVVGWICAWFISIHAPRVGSDPYKGY